MGEKNNLQEGDIVQAGDGRKFLYLTLPYMGEERLSSVCLDPIGPKNFGDLRMEIDRTSRILSSEGSLMVSKPKMLNLPQLTFFLYHFLRNDPKYFSTIVGQTEYNASRGFGSPLVANTSISGCEGVIIIDNPDLSYNSCFGHLSPKIHPFFASLKEDNFHYPADSSSLRYSRPKTEKEFREVLVGPDLAQKLEAIEKEGEIHLSPKFNEPYFNHWECHGDPVLLSAHKRDFFSGENSLYYCFAFFGVIPYIDYKQDF